MVFWFKAIWESKTVYASALLLYEWCGKTWKYCDIAGHLQDPELDIFMVEILVYSIMKLIQALLAKAARQHGTQIIEFHHFCLCVAIGTSLSSWETRVFSLARSCLMWVMFSSTTRWCHWLQFEENGAQNLYWHKGPQFQWCEAQGTAWL